MAGLGRRTFAPGEVLTASNVMNYLQDQVVQTYANDGARGSAIGTAVSEGMVSYLSDSNEVQVYNGSAWLSLGPTNKIVQVEVGNTATAITSSSTTPVDTTLTATITPRYSNSLIFVMVAQNVNKTFGNASNGVTLRLLRGATLLIQFAAFQLATGSTIENSGVVTYFRLDNPATTSPVTYKTQINNSFAAASVRAQFNGASSIVLMEIEQQ
jgi:hypothetical protein